MYYKSVAACGVLIQCLPGGCQFKKRPVKKLQRKEWYFATSLTGYLPDHYSLFYFEVN